MLYKIKILFIFITCFGLQLKGQTTDSIIDGIRLSVNQETVQLEWEILAGNSCLGMTIERYENHEYSKIGYIGGICGGTEDEYYWFTDSIPLVNTENCYRLILGGEGVTSAFCVHFTAFNNGFYLQKGQEQLKFLFEKQYQSSRISFYSLNGRLVHSKLLNGDELMLDRNIFRSGIYFFTLEGIEHTKFIL
ncbi:MAG: hypothetical protein HOH84_01375 [Flavobacteriaceae bacterium]|jgi:hypothetical protein|nr:hypothetical protein [Candidatus Neomarinimicrobiota bacterium]MBT5856953.1 hypothetical protein [Flavobacteriaceae bacterium]MBT6965782.1 hypothetical protein [Flavobacteriales bacterium]